MSSQGPIRREDDRRISKSIFEDGFDIIGDDEINEAYEEQRNNNAIRIVKEENYFFRNKMEDIRSTIMRLLEMRFDVYEITKALKSGGYKSEDIETIVTKVYPFMIEDEKSYFRFLAGLGLDVVEVTDKMAKFMKEHSPGDEKCVLRLIMMVKESGYFKEVKAQDMIQTLLDNFVFTHDFERYYLYGDEFSKVFRGLVENGYTAEELKDLRFFMKNIEIDWKFVRQVVEFSRETGKVNPLLGTWEDSEYMYKALLYGPSKKLLRTFYTEKEVDALDWLPFEK